MPHAERSDRLEEAVAVTDVRVWLSRVSTEEAARVLVGCALDDDSGAEPVAIVGMTDDRRALILESGRRVPLAGIAGGAIVDPRPRGLLKAAVAAARSPSELREREERLALGHEGIDADKLASGDDRHAVLVLLQKLAAGVHPVYSEWHACYRALSAGGNAGLARAGARIFSDLAARFAAAGGIPDDLHWRRAWFLRASVRLREAIAVSDALHAGNIKEPGARKFLATTRMGSLMDLFEVTGDLTLLALADRAGKVAYAVGPHDDEVKAAYRRLDALRVRAAKQR